MCNSDLFIQINAPSNSFIWNCLKEKIIAQITLSKPFRQWLEQCCACIYAMRSLKEDASLYLAVVPDIGDMRHLRRHQLCVYHLVWPMAREASCSEVQLFECGCAVNRKALNAALAFSNNTAESLFEPVKTWNITATRDSQQVFLLVLICTFSVLWSIKWFHGRFCFNTENPWHKRGVAFILGPPTPCWLQKRLTLWNSQND